MDLTVSCNQWLAQLFAPWVQDLGLSVAQVQPGEVTLVLPITPQVAREGGTLCGQAMMAAADTAMVLAISTQLGEFRPMTTVCLNTSFMRAIKGDHLLVVARVLKPGRTMVFGEIQLLQPESRQLAAHVTTTYALL